MKKYENILNKRNELLNQSSIEDVDLLMQMESIDTFFECEKYEIYENICLFAEKRGFKTVYDIGCAFGFQSECFVESDIAYIGIEACKLDFYNNEKYHYIQQPYPFKINIEEPNNVLAVSVMCLSWECYLYDGENTLRKQFDSLSRDFKHCLLKIQKNKLDIIKEYFCNVEKIDDDLYYFSN